MILLNTDYHLHVTYDCKIRANNGAHQHLVAIFDEHTV